MAVQSQVTRKSLGTALFAAVVGLAAGLSTGCVNVETGRDGKPLADRFAGAKNQGPSRIVTRWQPEVAFAPDPTRGGATIPGIVGRMYLFSPTDVLLDGDGSIHVELFDGSVEPPKLLETWEFPQAEAQKLKKQDAFGPGYSMFLPWSSYHKDRTQIQMRVAYKAAKGGSPVYANSGPIQLGGPRAVVSSSSYTTGRDGVVPPAPQGQLPRVPAAIPALGRAQPTMR